MFSFIFLKTSPYLSNTIARMLKSGGGSVEEKFSRLKPIPPLKSLNPPTLIGIPA